MKFVKKIQKNFAKRKFLDMNLDESEDMDLINDELDDVTEIESHNIEENLDDLEALISDTKSTRSLNLTI